MNKNIGNKRKKYIIIGIVSVVILLSGFVWNTVTFYNKLGFVIERYISDKNRQVSLYISSKLKSDTEFIEDFADTLSRMPERLLTEEMLERKADAVGLEKVVVITKDNNQQPHCLGGKEEICNWSIENKEIWEKPQVSIFDREVFLFSAPVITDGEVNKLVVGIENYEKLYGLYQESDKWQQGAHILADKTTGEVLMLEIGSKSALSEDTILRVLEKTGINEDSTLISDKGYIISIEKVKGTNWVQFSVAYEDEFYSFFNINIQISFILIIIEAIFFLILFLLFRKDAKRKEKMYLTDTITGGHNREGFLVEGKKFYQNHDKSKYTIVCLNICDFGRINELWGEENGNNVLRFVYKILHENLNGQEFICRNSMDHFVLLMREKNIAVINQRLTKAIEQMNESIHKRMYGYNMEFSIGGCSLDIEDNIALAISKGLYMSKQGKEKNVCHFYDETVAKQQEEEYEINELFEESLKNHDFKVYLQPKVSKDGEYKAEALVRWIHPRIGFLAPDKFIPLFEKNGKIYQLDLYVFEEVCKILSSWIKNGKKQIEISVNLSRVTIKESRENIWKNYIDIKEKYNIPDGLLEIELTETALIERNQISYIRVIINNFRNGGFKVALDDFGFAYSSLAVLRELNVDTIKLDRTFFLEETPKSIRIVKDIIHLVHHLDMCVVAEGIEEIEQANTLWDSGCDYIQGYVYSKPLSLEQFEEWRRNYEK